MSYANRTLEFHKIYKEQILPILRSYEVYRRREYRKHKIIASILITMSLMCILLFIFIHVPSLFIAHITFDIFRTIVQFGTMPVMLFFLLIASLPIILAICIAHCFISLNKKNKAFANTLKADCMEKILQVFGNIKWHHEGSIDYDDKKTICDKTIKNCGLFLDYNHRIDDDCFYGTYKSIPFKILETHLWEESGSGKNRYVITAHKGIILEFQTNKQTKNRTIIQTKGDITAKQEPLVCAFLMLLGCLKPLLESNFNIVIIIATILSVLIIATIAIKDTKKQEPLNKVTLEDVSFNKRFDVYSSDQTEARYMITTAFMERFYKIKTTFKAKNIKCSFIGDKLIIALQTKKDLFEIGSLFKSLESPESMNDFYNELSSILNMVEYFKLNEKTKL